jgi:hypothetical protein
LIAQSAISLELSNPSVGRCCACATAGHAADKLISAMNSRRFIANPVLHVLDMSVGNFRRRSKRSNVRVGSKPEKLKASI